MAPLFCIPYERWSRATLVRRVEECPIPKRLLHFLIPRLLARGFAVEDDLGDGFVRLRVSEAERRQAKQDIRCVEDAVIEMLRNARDAHARTIIMGTSRSGDARRIIVADDGDGIPERLRRSNIRAACYLEAQFNDHGRVGRARTRHGPLFRS